VSKSVTKDTNAMNWEDQGFTDYAERFAQNKPQDTQAYQNANQVATQLQNASKNLGTESGRNSAISNIYKNRSAGVNALDQSIYQGTGDFNRDANYYNNRSAGVGSLLNNANNNFRPRKIDVTASGRGTRGVGRDLYGEF